MSVLLLRLAGPLQSWGASSRFVRRTTEPRPTKSGVIGLLASALGRRRTDPLEDLIGLRFGVRSDQPGTLVRDFQTIRSLDGTQAYPLSYRYYLSDGAFLAAVAGPDDLVAGLDEAVRSPAFPLYLGRRSCPPVGPVSLGVRAGDPRTALTGEPWRATALHQRRRRNEATVRLDVVLDAEEPGNDVIRDVPMSFDPRRRTYGWRSVTHELVEVDNPAFEPPSVAHDGSGVHDHDPYAALGGL